MVVLIKQIKPQRFKDAEFSRVMRNALRRAGYHVKKDFEETTATWKNKPTFRVSTHVTPRLPSPSVEVWTDDEIYRYVNEGTRPHPIFAGYYTGKSDKKVLAFPSVFAPKTRPGSTRSGAGMSAPPMVFTPYVDHPGTEARKFDEQIKEKRKGWFMKLMHDAMREAAKASGHGM